MEGWVRTLFRLAVPVSKSRRISRSMSCTLASYEEGINASVVAHEGGFALYLHYFGTICTILTNYGRGEGGQRFFGNKRACFKIF